MDEVFAPVPGTDGLFSAERVVWRGWSLRSFALALPAGGSLIISPVKRLAESAHASLAQAGAPKVFLAPNHFHHVGLPEGTRRYPGGLVVSSDAARPRLSSQRPGLAFGPLAEAAALLPPGASFLLPEGTRIGEVWLRLEGPKGVAWVVSDAFFHVTDRVPGAPGLFLRATRATPGLSLGDTFKWLATRDRRRYRAWLLDRLERDQPTVMAFGHGAALEDPALPGRLRALAEARL